MLLEDRVTRNAPLGRTDNRRGWLNGQVRAGRKGESQRWFEVRHRRYADINSGAKEGADAGPTSIHHFRCSGCACSHGHLGDSSRAGRHFRELHGVGDRARRMGGSRCAEWRRCGGELRRWDRHGFPKWEAARDIFGIPPATRCRIRRTRESVRCAARFSQLAWTGSNWASRCRDR